MIFGRTLKLFKTKGVQNSMKEFDDDLNKINKHHSSDKKDKKTPNLSQVRRSESAFSSINTVYKCGNFNIKKILLTSRPDFLLSSAQSILRLYI